jgi:hypothetical protein
MSSRLFEPLSKEFPSPNLHMKGIMGKSQVWFDANDDYVWLDVHDWMYTRQKISTTLICHKFGSEYMIDLEEIVQYKVIGTPEAVLSFY